MDATQQHNLSIGLTYAVRHLKLCFKASKLIYKSDWVTEAHGDEHEARRSKIEETLKSNNRYTTIGEGTQITGAALTYIYRTDNLVENLVNPAKNGLGDWKPTRGLHRRLFDDMERDLKQLLPPSDQVVHGTLPGFTEWKLDAAREQWYYWCSVDRTFKYQDGMWLRLDGSRTSLAEEVELAKACGVLLKGPSLDQNRIYPGIASMKQLTTSHVDYDEE